MSSNWVRPPAEEDQFNRLSVALAIPKEELCACRRGLRRFIKKFILASANSQGKTSDHLVVLFNDALLIAEIAVCKRHDQHEYDIQYNLPLLGLAVSAYPGIILLEHHQEGLHVILEGRETLLKPAFEAIQDEVQSVNEDVDHLPTSVVRPSRDPRHRTMSQGSCSDVALVRPTPRHMDDEGTVENPLVLSDEDQRREMQRVAAAAEAKLRRRQARERRSIRPEITEITEDDEIQEAAFVTGVPYNEEEARQEAKTRGENMMVENIFGANYVEVLRRHNVQFAQDIEMMDNDWSLNTYQIVCFVDFFVVQRYPSPMRIKKVKKWKLNQPQPVDSDNSDHEDTDEYEFIMVPFPYEVYMLGECTPSVQSYSEHTSLIELTWPHNAYRFEMDNDEALLWMEKFNSSMMINSAIVPPKEIGVIGSCVVRRGSMSYGNRAPKPISPQGLVEAANYGSCVQVQRSLGPSCNWIVGERRGLVSQAAMDMFDEMGNIERRRVILLSDRVLITKPAQPSVHENHTHDVIDNIDLLEAEFSRSEDIIFIKTPRNKRFLGAKSVEMAQNWLPQAVQTKRERKERIEFIKRNIELYKEEQRRLEKARQEAREERRRREILREIDRELSYHIEQEELLLRLQQSEQKKTQSLLHLQPLRSHQKNSAHLSDLTNMADTNLDISDNDDDGVAFEETVEETLPGTTSGIMEVESSSPSDHRPTPPVPPASSPVCIDGNDEFEDWENQPIDVESNGKPKCEQSDRPCQPLMAHKRRASTPVQTPRKKHPRLRLSFRNSDPRQREEIVEETPSMYRNEDQTSRVSNSFDSPVRNFDWELHAIARSLALPHPTNQQERERNAMFIAGHRRAMIEERINTRKRREGQGSSKDCFLPPIIHLAHSPSSSRIAAHSPNPFIGDDEDLDLSPQKESSRSNMMMDDMDEDESFYDTSDTSGEINESDLIIPEDKDTYPTNSVTPMAPAEEEVVVDGESENESEEEDEIVDLNDKGAEEEGRVEIDEAHYDEGVHVNGMFNGDVHNSTNGIEAHLINDCLLENVASVQANDSDLNGDSKALPILQEEKEERIDKEIVVL